MLSLFELSIFFVKAACVAYPQRAGWLSFFAAYVLKSSFFEICDG